MSKIIIVSDNAETFTKSQCKCEFCFDIHKASMDWESYVPETNIQKNMLAIVKHIEQRENGKIVNKRRSPRLLSMKDTNRKVKYIHI